ncbi:MULTISPECIES: 3-dehydroquinate synthase family protein [Acidithrix]|uniref:3-dehydroquinate synthase n=1 Tax=Acidithrix ferrooxidans TaxID=1280514 RepID=A0A0D8HFS7_9ACTN|nr:MULTISPECIES: 3-dehydroquinate synthase family protein [Acidithrix]KJF16778.1 3-dehydroquinate synthase [Acidithrix ferrooxidans]CAG4931228.1 unnamed protein product [Acidithrix sp. C25]
MRETYLNLGDDRGYPILVGNDLLDEWWKYLPEDVSKVVILRQPNIPMIPDPPNIASSTFVIEDGENAKRISTVERLLEEIAAFGLSRRDCIVNVGGGVVSDLGGFVASIYFRGIRYINISTTLLGQIDAAIGGKTGVNLSAGKNLAGSFWHPSSVICDVSTLKSLPEREFRSGLGEMAKYEFLGAGNLDVDDLEASISQCVKIKADVVSFDEREGGRRALLNYGHTMAHGLEALSLAGKISPLMHGEAVGIGLIFAGHLSHIMGRISSEMLDRHYEIVSRFELSTSIPDSVDFDDVIGYLARDKKAYGSLTFVLMNQTGELEVVNGIPSQLIESAIASMGSYHRN